MFKRSLRFVPLLLSLAAGLVHAQGFELGLRRVHAFGTGTYGPTLADLNGDGRPDLIVSNTGVDSVTYRFGDGFGNFGVPVRLATGDGPRASAVGDLNGDGRPDLVVANTQGNSVSYFRGLGNGTFAPAVNFGVGTDPRDVAIGDASGDGRPDVVTVNSGSSTVTILYGGSGLSGASLTLSTGGGPMAVALGDFDANGVSDIATANGNAATVSIFRGLPAGGFAAKVDYATATGPHQIEAADVDNDGDLDLVTASPSPGMLSTLYNNGTGAFPFHDDLPIPNDTYSLGLADLTGDGIVDAALGSGGSADLTIVRGLGFGTFFSPQGFTTFQGVIFGVTVGDLDLDGRRDVVMTCQSGKIVTMMGARLPFGTHQDFTVGTSPFDVAIADLDGDTFPDLVTANNGSANASVLLNAHDGTFPTHVEYPTTPYPGVVRLGDFGSDGRPDLFVATSSPFNADTNRVVVLPNLGNGTFGARNSFDRVQGRIVGLALGDLNGDARLDFVDTHYDNNAARVYLGDGNGSFSLLLPITTLLTPLGVHLANIDVTGGLDILMAESGSNAVSRYLGDGTGGFSPRVSFGVGANGPSEIATADLDGDGNLDLAVLNQASQAISLMTGNGVGSFGIPTVLPAQATSGIAVRDVNRDGILDLVYGTGDKVVTRYGQGDGTWGPARSSPSLGQRFALALGDLDHNGTIDAATALIAGNAVAILNGLQQTRTSLTVTPNPSILNGPMTLTATVTPEWPDSSDPGGVVRFFDGFTLLGTAPIQNGAAVLNRQASFPWDRSFRADYLGDFRFHGSLSASVPQFTYIATTGTDPAPTPTGLFLAPERQPAQGDALRLRFGLVTSDPAELGLFDVRGRQVRTRSVGDLGPGIHSVDLAEGGRLAPGVYLVRLVQGALRAGGRVVVL